jgi:hypothetical protein
MNQELINKFNKSFTKEKDKKNPCWIWNKSEMRFGFDFVRYNARDISLKIYKNNNTSISKKKSQAIYSICKNTKCVNPDHLQILTKEESGRRMMTGKKHSPETRKKLKEFWSKSENREKISKINLGRKHSLETRKKISTANTGKRRSEEVCEKMRLIQNTKKMRAIKIKTHLGKVNSDEMKKMLHLANIGEKNPISKLKEEDVLYIRKNSTKYSHTYLAEIFSVSRSNIGRIVNNGSWKHLI